MIVCSGQLQQRFGEEPRDTSVIRGQDAILRCSVINLQGPVQWLKGGFGLGPGPHFDGYPRYRILQHLPDNGIVVFDRMGTLELLSGIAYCRASDSSYSVIPLDPTHFSIAWSVCLSSVSFYLCNWLKLSNEFTCYF